MTRTRVTPFLIVNPIVIIWATYALIRVMTRDGMAVMMSGFFLGLIVVSFLLLIVDRLVVRKINLWLLVTIEILLVIVSFKLADLYIYG